MVTYESRIDKCLNSVNKKTALTGVTNPIVDDRLNGYFCDSMPLERKITSTPNSKNVLIRSKTVLWLSLDFLFKSIAKICVGFWGARKTDLEWDYQHLSGNKFSQIESVYNVSAKTYSISACWEIFLHVRYLL